MQCIVHAKTTYIILNINTMYNECINLVINYYQRRSQKFVVWRYKIYLA